MKPQLPQDVNDVLEQLEKDGDERLGVMKLLTQPDIDTYNNYYEAMWWSIFNEEKKHVDETCNKWVLRLLDDVIESQKVRPYFFLSGQKREQLINKIKKHTKALQKIYSEFDLDPCLIDDNGQFFQGFCKLDENDNPILENGHKPKVSFSEALEFFAHIAEEEIRETAHPGKIVVRQNINRFIRNMGFRNLQRYRSIKSSTIKNMVYAIYKNEYTDQDIVDLIKGRK